MIPAQQWLKAIDRGDLACLQQLHQQGWQPAQEAICPLARAALRAQPHLVQWLLELGLAPDPGRPFSALHCACSGQDTLQRRQVIEQLLAAGCDIDALNGNDRTPLMCALSVGGLDLAHYLIGLGASWTRANNMGQRAEDFFVSGTPGAREQFQAMILEAQTAPAPKPARSTRRL